jgi:DNA-binding transcriptional regulator YhcF (GntR family)
MELSSIVVEPQAPITINAQIIEQVKLLISIKELQSGSTLPTVVELAKHLGINHNTVAAVYNNLLESGYLVATRGKGTFIAQSLAVQNIRNRQPFYDLLAQAYKVAAQFGINPSEFGVAAYAQAVWSSRHRATPLKLVLVEEKQYEAILSEAIQSAIEAPVLFLDWKDLKAEQSKDLKELWLADLVITTAQYLWEVTSIATLSQEVCVVDVKPDLKLLIQFTSLPRHANLLIVAQEIADSEVMKKMLQQAGINHLNFQVIDLKFLEQNLQLLELSERVCASREVFDYVRQQSTQPEKVIIFNFSLEQINISVLKARITAIQEEKSVSALDGVS